MNRIAPVCKRLLCLLLLLSICGGSISSLAVDFPDTSGHWSEAAMKAAYQNGLISGYSDGTIGPDNPVTRAEALSVLVRVLSASVTADISGYGLDPDAWYYEWAAAGSALSLFAPGDAATVTAPITRESLFIMTAEAFQLVPARQDTDCLSRFADADALSYEGALAAAALVEGGYVVGSDGFLFPGGTVTRAEFVTILGKLIQNYILTGELTSELSGASILPVPTASPEAGEAGEAPEESPSEPEDAPDTSADAPTETDEDSEPPAGAELEVPAETDPTEPEETEPEGNDQNAPEEAAPAEPDMTGSPIVSLKNLTLQSDLILNCFTTKISLESIVTDSRILIRSGALNALSMSGGAIARLVLAAQSGNVSFTPEDGGTVETFVVGSGGGSVRLSGDISNVEITGSGRTVTLSAMHPDSLVISGSGNTIVIDAGCAVRELVITGSGIGNQLLLNGTASSLTVSGDSTGVSGIGVAGTALVTGRDCAVAVSCGTYEETVDYGLEGVDIALASSADPVPAGGGLTVSAAFPGARGTVICAAQWYQNGEPAAGYGNGAFSLAEGAASSYSPEIVFAQDMADSIVVGLELTYTRNGVPQRVYREITVTIENYPDDYYAPPDPIEAQTWSESYNLVRGATILSSISAVYKGNYTLSYNVDYSTEAKEEFVNANGYASDTEYLVWLNLGAQKCYIFKGSKANWSLLYTFVVATGASSSPTPTGVFKTTYKQSGWYTSSYTCRPIVRFKGGGYAFHSRLYYPGTNTLNDASIGYPVSHGCIRMYDSDILWMYNNLPNGSTVVVY